MRLWVAWLPRGGRGSVESSGRSILPTAFGGGGAAPSSGHAAPTLLRSAPPGLLQPPRRWIRGHAMARNRPIPPPVSCSSSPPTRGFACASATPPSAEDGASPSAASGTPKRRRRRKEAESSSSSSSSSQGAPGAPPSWAESRRTRREAAVAGAPSSPSRRSTPPPAAPGKGHAASAGAAVVDPATPPKPKKEKKPRRPSSADLSPSALAEAEMATWQAADAPSLAAAEQLVHEVRQHLSYRYYPRKVFLDHLPEAVTAKDLLKTFAGLGGAGQVDAVVVLEVMRPWDRRNRRDPRLPGPRAAILQLGDKATYDRALSDDVRMFGICWQRHVFKPSRGLGRNLFLALSTGEFTITDLCGKGMAEPLPVLEDGLEGLLLAEEDGSEAQEEEEDDDDEGLSSH